MIVAFPLGRNMGVADYIMLSFFLLFFLSLFWVLLPLLLLLTWYVSATRARTGVQDVTTFLVLFGG